jgi:hypothetical protein
MPVSIQTREPLFCIKVSVTTIMPMLDGKRIYIEMRGGITRFTKPWCKVGLMREDLHDKRI